MGEKADASRFFHFWEAQMKTRIYVDGYNLYYGCLKNTPYKWLDLIKLVENAILPSSIPEDYSISSLDMRYFTAPISGRAAQDDDSVKDQANYHRALEALYPPSKFDIIQGYFSVADTFAFKIDDEQPDREPRYCERVKVWKLEEKQTDVNIAVEALYDALTDTSLEHMVFVTNDTDIAPALHKIKQATDIKIGVIVPTKETVRRVSEKLTSEADWFRSNIKDIELNASSLPRSISVSTRQKLRKPIAKPISWYGQSQLVHEIISTLLPVMRNKRNKCWQWLETEKPDVDGIPKLEDLPVNLLNDTKTAADVLAHAQAYVKYIESKRS
jgi:uncharacterized LabA/DUF88 family protein